MQNFTFPHSLLLLTRVVYSSKYCWNATTLTILIYNFIKLAVGVAWNKRQLLSVVCVCFSKIRHELFVISICYKLSAAKRNFLKLLYSEKNIIFELFFPDSFVTVAFDKINRQIKWQLHTKRIYSSFSPCFHLLSVFCTCVSSFYEQGFLLTRPAHCSSSLAVRCLIIDHLIGSGHRFAEPWIGTWWKIWITMSWTLWIIA